MGDKITAVNKAKPMPPPAGLFPGEISNPEFEMMNLLEHKKSNGGD
jgi:hypothetical protein